MGKAQRVGEEAEGGDGRISKGQILVSAKGSHGSILRSKVKHDLLFKNIILSAVRTETRGVRMEQRGQLR